MKQELTDKYVVVDETRPELARFRGAVGQVKTVNMSGRALVEFPLYANIGWYDIEPEFLKIVDAPPPPTESKEEKPAATPAKKPAAAPAAKAAPAGGEKKLSPLEMARMQGAAGSKPAAAKAAPAAAPAKASTADILAAARTKKGASAAAPAASETAKPVAAPADKVDRSKLSVADMIAMARGQKPAAAAPAPAAPAEPEPAEPEPAAEEPQVAAPVAKEASQPAGGDRPKAGELSTEQILAWCRAHDAKS